MTAAERRRIGAHYTTEENILKTIRPLFVDDLEQDITTAGSLHELEAIHGRLAALPFLDPACGCGNFLLIAYRELRRLELTLLQRIQDARGKPSRSRRARADQMSLAESRVGVGQFYDIEIKEFPAHIAETAMYFVDHLANRELSAAFGRHYVRFPISDTAHIQVANALRTDWNDAAECTYVFGSPPFSGAAMMTDEQRADNRHVFETARVTATRTGRLDYVACWYAKALDYGRDNKDLRVAFVSTNSITQGEQARTIGPMILEAGYAIDFAHRTFAWKSEARGRAAVHVAIIGFSQGGATRHKMLFDYLDPRLDPVEIRPSNINPYLVDAPDIIPGKRSEPFWAELPIATQGSKPWDGGHLLVTPTCHAGRAPRD